MAKLYTSIKTLYGKVLDMKPMKTAGIYTSNGGRYRITLNRKLPYEVLEDLEGNIHFAVHNSNEKSRFVATVVVRRAPTDEGDWWELVMVFFQKRQESSPYRILWDVDRKMFTKGVSSLPYEALLTIESVNAVKLKYDAGEEKEVRLVSGEHAYELEF